MTERPPAPIGQGRTEDGYDACPTCAATFWRCWDRPDARCLACRSQLGAERERLEQTLATGWTLCDEARDAGDADKLARYEDRFIVRLREYEAVSDQLAAGGAP